MSLSNNGISGRWYSELSNRCMHSFLTCSSLSWIGTDVIILFLYFYFTVNNFFWSISTCVDPQIACHLFSVIAHTCITSIYIYLQTWYHLFFPIPVVKFPKKGIIRPSYNSSYCRFDITSILQNFLGEEYATPCDSFHILQIAALVVYWISFLFASSWLYNSQINIDQQI